MSTTLRLLIVSSIPVLTDAVGQHWCNDLWVTDVAANARHVDALTVLAPRALAATKAKDHNTTAWPTGVTVVHDDQVQTGHNADALDALLARHDVVSIATGRPSWHMQREQRVMQAAKRLGKPVVLSVSSNRAATTLMNAKGQGPLKQVKARITAHSIMRITRAMAKQSAAVMVVGQGVAQAMGLQDHPGLQVETASWIDASLIASDADFAARCAATWQHAAASACFAGRLEPMKGAHVGIEALALMASSPGAPRHASLSIFGQGPAEAELRALAQARQRNHAALDVRFEGTCAYPHEFLQAIAAFDLVLMTNLNDEQPRLVFDAISQGVIPLCPDTRTYRALGLPDAVFFERGNAASLASVWGRFHDASLRLQTMQALRPLAFEFTIEAMHRRRGAWMRKL